MKRIILLLTLAAVLAFCAAGSAENSFTVNYNGNTFWISRPGSMSGTTQTVTLRTVSETALEGIHYTGQSLEVTFEPGQTMKTISFVTTESSWDNVPLLYRYQNDAGRNYYVEVLDAGGRAVGRQSRLFRDDGGTYRLSLGDVNTGVSGLLYLQNGAFATGMASGKYADISGTESGWTLVTDAGYGNQTPYQIDPASYFSRFNAPASYFREIGDKLYAAVGFDMKEDDDGYQYIQILVNTTSNYDGNDGDGTVNKPSVSLYKACFELSGTGSVVTDEKKMFFPHQKSDKTRASQDPSVWTEFPTDESTLWQQDFKNVSYQAANTGAVIIDPADTIVVRFDAAGKYDDDWYFNNLFARVALVDEKAPELANVVVSSGPYRPGGTVHVSLCFSEPVKASSSSGLETSWGSLVRESASGANVLTYGGTISADATGALSLTSPPAGVTDIAGHALSVNETVAAIINSLLSSKTLSAPYPYAITYDLDGGTLPSGYPASYTFTGGAVTLPTPSREHYTFAGWTGFGLSGLTQSVTIPAGSTGDRAYKANWTPISYSINYQLNGGTHTNPDTYTIEDTLTLTAPDRPGYIFTGWTGTGLNGLTLDVTIPAGSSGSRSYTAHWSEPIVYTISYDLGDESLQTTNPTQYTVLSEAITLANPTRAHYTFAGWTGTDLGETPDMEVTIPAGSTGNRAYTACWLPVSYAINYELDGGTLPSGYPATYTIEDAVTLLAPTRTDYEFTGWTGTDLGATPEPVVTIPAGSCWERSYTAHWSPVSYSISYDLGGGSLPQDHPANYTIESEAITLVNPTRTGYAFTGWTGTGLSGLTLEVIIPTGSYGSRTYTANWEAISYTIQYNYGSVELFGNPSSQLNPSQYTSDSAITLNNPRTYGGIVFLGWTGTGLGTDPVLEVTIPAGSTGNRSYTANWAEDVRCVSWQGSSLRSETLPDSPKTLTSQDTEWSGSCPVVAVGDVTISGRVTVSGNVLLILMDGSNLSASAGITVNSGSILTISVQAFQSGASFTPGAGTLTVDSPTYDCAGIGSDKHHDAGEITILGGAVNVTANDSAAGIGGGLLHRGGNIFIRGGTVSASGKQGAAIGGGNKGSGTVTISGGTVTATTNALGAAVGGGDDGSGTVTISGGMVNATTNGTGAGIGGGDGSNGSAVTISGGTVTATTNSYGAAIGSGKGFSAHRSTATVTISGGTVTATTNGDGAAIGSGEGFDIDYGTGFSTATVTISGGVVTATAEEGSSGAGIGSGGCGSSVVQITGGEVTAQSETATAAIGGNQSAVTISGGTVRATNTIGWDAIGGPGTAVTLTWEAGENGAPLPCSVKASKYGNLTLSKPFFYPSGGVLRVAGGGSYELSQAYLTGVELTPYNPAALPAFGTPVFTLPTGLDVVEANAFEGDTAITVVDARNCTSIGAYAFKNCTALTQILVSSDCVIDDTAFEGCTSLIAVYGLSADYAEDLMGLTDIPAGPAAAE